MSEDHPELESLSAYLDGELGSRERGKVEEHLMSCPACSAIRAKLAAAAERLAALPALEMTADEHRALRQAALKARPDRPSPWTRRYLQWAVAGGLVLVAMTAVGFGFLRVGSSDGAGSESLTEPAAPTAGQPAFDFTSGAQVDRTVASLPEVAAGVNRYRPEDAPAATGGDSGSGKAGDYGGSSSGSDQEGARQHPAPAMAEPDGAGPSGGGGAEGDVRTEARDDRAPKAAAPLRPFSNDAADSCLERVTRTQSYPMVPLLARQATYQGTPAWLLVFAWSPEPEVGKTLDRWQTWLVTPQDCQNLTGPELEARALYRSFSGQT